jgi:hypothetical protein
MTSKTPWEILSAVDVGDKIEKKNNLSYLSWAWAWGVLKQHFPNSGFTKHTAPNGMPYFIDNQGYAFVRVTVSLNHEGSTDITEMLPVLDHRNKPIQGPNAFEVNNALQRCLAKAIAYHGLGHYIYAGEDVPQEAVGGPSEAPNPRPAPTPAQTPQSPSSALADGSVGIVNPSGEIVNGGNTVDMIVAVFTNFIPHCKDEKSLTKFYTQNKLAIQILKDRDEAKHKMVLDAFAAHKATLKLQSEGK